jgi:hypothetical protein
MYIASGWFQYKLIKVLIYINKKHTRALLQGFKIRVEPLIYIYISKQ